MSKRLSQKPNEWINRKKSVTFRFEGRDFKGFEGDRLSTALWASGVRVLGRSFKYHRPRGILSLSGLDCNALVENQTSTNVRMDSTAIQDGMDFRAVNTWGGVASDLYRIMDFFSSLMPVGFYYKTFHRPSWLFPFFERKMRQVAGLGKVPPDQILRKTPKRYDFCDLLVIGAGPAGLSSALVAGKLGLKVLVVEEEVHPGGTLSYQLFSEQEGPGTLNRLLSEIANHPNIEIRTQTSAAGYYADHWIALVDPQKMTKLRARSVIVSSGCYEQLCVFRNNDLPGVMLASAAQRLIHQFSVRPFQKALVLTANSDGYRAAVDLQQSGVSVVLIADLRPEGEPSIWKDQVLRHNIPIQSGTAIYEAIPSSGKQGIKGAVLCSINSQGHVQQSKEQDQVIYCDGIAMSVGWAPADGILRQAGGQMVYKKALEQYVPEELPPGIFAAGRLNGVYFLSDQLKDGTRAGCQAAAYLGKADVNIPSSVDRQNSPMSHPFPIISHPKGKNFVDLDEDIQLKDLENSVQEGFDSMELLKRYSTFGMGPSQGKHSNLNTGRILSKLKGKSLINTGLTTSRPFTNPVSLGHLAGRIFSPYRQTPLHIRHKRLGTQFMYAGNWLRPEYYPSPLKTREETIHDEVKVVRTGVGIIDVSTLGKLEIFGPDAVEFIERMYTGRFTKLKEGKSRYILMCDESGVMVDDGIAARLATDSFYVTTTSSASDSAAREMNRWAISWSLNVNILNVTGMYGAINLAGPLSRKVLQSLIDIDLDSKNFPYLAVRKCYVGGAPARVLRVGFVGEWGYEIHVLAESMLPVWDQIIDKGALHGIRPFGVEAQRLLRLEKGHLIVGQDSDGLSYPQEAGLDWAVKTDKSFFIGQRSLTILNKNVLKRQLVGFVLPKKYDGPIPKESHLVIEKGEITGRVTSVAFSPTLGHIIGMAYVETHLAKPKTTIQILINKGHLLSAQVAHLPFYDPKNLRQSETQQTEGAL
jgi:sarcosine oxidase subunit alpha